MFETVSANLSLNKSGPTFSFYQNWKRWGKLHQTKEHWPNNWYSFFPLLRSSRSGLKSKISSKADLSKNNHPKTFIWLDGLLSSPETFAWKKLLPKRTLHACILGGSFFSVTQILRVYIQNFLWDTISSSSNITPGRLHRNLFWVTIGYVGYTLLWINFATDEKC